MCRRQRRLRARSRIRIRVVSEMEIAHAVDERKRRLAVPSHQPAVGRIRSIQVVRMVDDPDHVSGRGVGPREASLIGGTCQESARRVSDREHVVTKTWTRAIEDERTHVALEPAAAAPRTYGAPPIEIPTLVAATTSASAFVLGM